jgi:hypothetical protein
MTVDRAIWLRRLDGTGLTPWPCPCCGTRLVVVQGTLHERETAESEKSKNHEAWEPRLTDGRFSCLMKCPSCKNPSAVAGTYTAEEDYDDTGPGEPTMVPTHTYKPTFFSDAPHIINVPVEVPDPIVDELNTSFKLFWVSPEACANSIRSAVEQLLTHFRVHCTKRNPKGERVFLSLHARIELFRRTNSKLADALMAVKWIGNAGSHSQRLRREDLLDGYELMEHVLDELFVQRHKRIARLSRQINRRKRPRSAKRGQPVERS